MLTCSLLYLSWKLQMRQLYFCSCKHGRQLCANKINFAAINRLSIFSAAKLTAHVQLQVWSVASDSHLYCTTEATWTPIKQWRQIKQTRPSCKQMTKFTKWYFVERGLGRNLNIRNQQGKNCPQQVKRQRYILTYYRTKKQHSDLTHTHTHTHTHIRAHKHATYWQQG